MYFDKKIKQAISKKTKIQSPFKMNKVIDIPKASTMFSFKKQQPISRISFVNNVLQNFNLKPRYKKSVDWDNDGVVNSKDCQPRNTMRQDSNGHITRKPRARKPKGHLKHKRIARAGPGSATIGGYLQAQAEKAAKKRRSSRMLTPGELIGIKVQAKRKKEEREEREREIMDTTISDAEEIAKQGKEDYEKKIAAGMTEEEALKTTELEVEKKEKPKVQKYTSVKEALEHVFDDDNNQRMDVVEEVLDDEEKEEELLSDEIEDEILDEDENEKNN